MSDFKDFIHTTIKKGDITEVRRRLQPQYKDQRYWKRFSTTNSKREDELFDPSSIIRYSSNACKIMHTMKEIVENEVINGSNSSTEMKKEVFEIIDPTSIIRAFSDTYKTVIIQNMKKSSSLTTEQKMEINKLSRAIQTSNILDKTSRILELILPLLEDFLPIIKHNFAAMRIVEIILYQVCEYTKDSSRNIDSSLIRHIQDISMKLWLAEQTSREIKLASAVSICQTLDDNSNVDVFPDILQHVSDEINVANSKGHLGFSETELKDAFRNGNRWLALTQLSDFEDFIDTAIEKGDIDEARRRWQPQYKDQRIYEGYTVLHLACMYTSGDREDGVRLLVSLGCDIEAQSDINGLRPLHICARHGSLEAMRALLGAGCSLSPFDKDGKTPLMIADREGHPECASLLRSAIARFNIRPSMTNYVEGDLLGSGAFGRVYKCHDPDIDMDFSIKKVPISVNGEENDEIKALDNEIKIYSKWDFHRRIVRYFGTTINKEEMIIFMEYVSNGSLKDTLKKSGPFSISMVAKYSKQILEGLDFLHTHKVIHRDIKAANILRDSKDDIKLADFGESKCVKTISNGNSVFTLVGSPHWMAPEVMTNKVIKKYEFKVDVWSLGATILEMLTGKPPYHDLDPFQAMYKIGGGAPVDDYFPLTLDQKTKSLLKKMFVHDPSKRADVKTLLES